MINWMGRLVSTGRSYACLIVILLGGMMGMHTVVRARQTATTQAPTLRTEAKQKTPTREEEGAPDGPHQSPLADPSQTDSRYRIGPGDVLNIQIYNRIQLSREAVRVDGRGTIRMPWIDDEIIVVCRTETEVAAEITARYRPLLRSPQVGVFVKEYQSQPVAVMGAVNQPGRFQLQRRVRLLELLTFAGGPAERAGRTVQIIHAPHKSSCDPPAETDHAAIAADPGNEAVPTGTGGADDEKGDDALLSFKLSDVLRSKAGANPVINPGDIITVLDAEQVYVVGNVLRPSTLTLREPLTISQAIAMAGGLLPDAKADRVRIVRQTPGGKKEIFVDLKAIDKRRAEDLVLQVNDIINVSASGGKSFVRTFISAVAPAMGQLPLRVVY